MPPPRNQSPHSQPDLQEHEYAIRDLVGAVERLTDQCEENTKEINNLQKVELRDLRDQLRDLKLKWAMGTTLLTVAIGVAMKLIPWHS